MPYNTAECSVHYIRLVTRKKESASAYLPVLLTHDALELIMNKMLQTRNQLMASRDD